MNKRDDLVREKLVDRLTAVNVDSRNLGIEVETGMVTVRGSVPSEDQRQRAVEALAGIHSISIFVKPIAPSDSPDGRGHSADT